MSDHLAIEHLPSGFRGALTRIAFALRSLRSRVNVDSVGEYRARNFPAELSAAIRGEHRPSMLPLVWLDRLASRWGIDLAGSDELPALRVYLGGGWVRWDEAMAGIRRDHLERIVEDYGALLATLATARVESDDEILTALLAIDEPDEVADPWTAPARTAALPSRWHFAAWTTTSPLAHGADEKDGNVSRFRTEARLDRATGRWVEIPFLSGNSIRGQLRDALFADLLARLGLGSHEIPARTAHALFAGGSVESGADTGGTDLALRRHWRAMLPAWDLLGGCIQQQVMDGRLRVRDAVPLCRETAEEVGAIVSPDDVPHRDRLPSAAELFEVRQLTRMAHREIDGDGGQMLVRTEVLRAGTIFAHGVAFTDPQTRPATRGALAHGLALLRDGGVIGAGSARGLGGMEVGEYRANGRGETLGDAAPYLAHLDASRDLIRDTLLGVLGPHGAIDATAALGVPKGRGRGKPAKGAPAPADDSDVGL